MKRVILYSDNPQDDNDLQPLRQKKQIGKEGKDRAQTESKWIGLRICDSEWTWDNFDMNSLKGKPI